MSHRPAADGKRIEELVSAIERLLMPQGFEVKTNTRLYNDNGVQLAEFDIEIRGKLGSVDIAWLIECRNRPSEGPAPGSWIEQLVGRRQVYKWDRVTAVSTTGFSASARNAAGKERIDLRQIDEITPEIASWLQLRTFHTEERRIALRHASLGISKNEADERHRAAEETVAKTPSDQPLLRWMKTGEVLSMADLYFLEADGRADLWEGIIPNQEPQLVHFCVGYGADETHLVVDTRAGPVRITKIDFEGNLAIVARDVPFTQISEYRNVSSDRAVSQTATFTFPVRGANVAVDLHRLVESGETHLGIRRVDDNNKRSPN